MMNYCVLLTATIAPRHKTFVRRSDPQIREADYMRAIQAVAKQVTYPIIFAENSGYDMAHIRDVLERCAHGRYEIIQTTDGQDYPPELGKGYGEFTLIQHVLDRSTLIQKDTHLIKITGRYSVANLPDVLSSIEDASDLCAVADFTPGARYAMSGFFICTPSFFSDYMAPLHGMMNDTEKRPFEHILQLALEQALKHGKKCLSFVVRPHIEGYSGTWNAQFKDGDPNKIRMSWGRVRIEWRSLMQRIRRRLDLLLHKAGK